VFGALSGSIECAMLITSCYACITAILGRVRGGIVFLKLGGGGGDCAQFANFCTLVMLAKFYAAVTNKPI
jgi:hypothetical protein